MEALILYSQGGRVPELAKAIADELRAMGHTAQLLQAESGGTGPISCGRYDLVVVGSRVVGVFGGKVADDIDASLKRCTRLEGKTTAAFVEPGLFGNVKALRHLMDLMERQGALVRDFASLATESDARKFAQAVAKLVS